MVTYIIEDPFVRAIFAKEGDCIYLVTVLDPVYHKEESGPVVMNCFLGSYLIWKRLDKSGWVGGFESESRPDLGPRGK